MPFGHSALSEDPQLALAGLIALARELAAIEDFTGRSRADVIT